MLSGSNASTQNKTSGSSAKIGTVAIIIIAALAITAYAVVTVSRTQSISEYLDDGASVTFELKGTGSRLKITLTSTNDYMYVKIIVDGQSVYEKNNIYNVNYNDNIGFSYHTVHIIFQNPTVFGLGSYIQISGTVSISFF